MAIDNATEILPICPRAKNGHKLVTVGQRAFILSFSEDSDLMVTILFCAECHHVIETFLVGMVPKEGKRVVSASDTANLGPEILRKMRGN